MKRSPLIDLHPAGTQYRQIGDASVPAIHTSLDAEHRAIRESGGLLDLSGDGGIRVRGRDAAEIVQAAVARDVEYLFPERCLTSLVLAEDGAVIDIATIYRDGEGFVLESSVGRSTSLLQHLHAVAGSYDADIAPIEDATFIGLEGPRSWEWLGRTIGVELTGLPFQGVATAIVHEAPVLVARIGVTGEFGYKLLVDIDAARALWAELAPQMTAVGYDALEIAMLEVRQPNLELEQPDGADPIVCGFNWIADPVKEAFVGRAALLEQFESNTIRTIGFEVRGAPVNVLDGQEVTLAGDVVGSVLCTRVVPLSTRVIGLARVRDEAAVSGQPILIGDDGGVEATTISSPYTVPTSWNVSIV